MRPNAPDPQSRRLRGTPQGHPLPRWGALLCVALAALAAGCEVSFKLLPASRQRAGDLRAAFTRAVDASNRAVMADTDEASIMYAREADQARQAVQRDADALAPLLRRLRDAEASRAFDEFRGRFAEYQALDHTLLALAVENTNLKAQRLSFGPAREAAATLQRALGAIARAAPPARACQVGALAAAAVGAVREIQVLHAPHIAEPEDAAMTRMEQEMAAHEAAARGALQALRGALPPSSQAQLADARAALDRFLDVHAQIRALSRRNTNVRSLALALGPKRPLTAACEQSLGALQAALANLGSRATR